MNSIILRSAASALLVLPIMLLSCSKNDEILPSEPVPISLTTDQTALIESGNEFAFDIFKNIISGENEGKNVMISPLSISSALSMTINGANGETREAMLEALRLKGITVDAVNKAYRDLTKALISVDKRVLISIANSVWTEDDFNVKKAFIDVLTQYYDAQSEAFDINDPNAPARMNAWIENKTNGLIKDMIESLDDNTVMLLINAIYFKGKWASEFDRTKTENLPFYLTSGSVNVPMMKQKSDFSVFEGNGFVMAEFPYGQGNFVMDVILPDQSSSLSGTMNLITDANFNGWISQMRKRETDVTFPKFKYGFKKKLKDVLSNMGMGIAFTDAADFSNISEQYDLLINEVTHQSFIETDEEGTEAAAATVVEIGLTSVGPTSFEFRMDRPFIFIIRETTTNSILFMGRVADPSAN
ncbi:MAG: serpin family protein [Bacteroidales bacterium]|nr:serpin family protein [Bacteroidales bacterium]